MRSPIRPLTLLDGPASCAALPSRSPHVSRWDGGRAYRPALNAGRATARARREASAGWGGSGAPSFVPRTSEDRSGIQRASQKGEFSSFPLNHSAANATLDRIFPALGYTNEPHRCACGPPLRPDSLYCLPS